MSHQIYRFIKFLEKVEGRKPPAMAIYKYDEENLNKDDYIDILKNDGKFIKYIIDKRIPLTNEMMLAAVSNDGNMLGVIKVYYRTKYSRIYLSQNELSPEELEKIKIPENIQIAAVKNNGVSIQYIDNPSEEIQMLAVNKTYQALRYIKNPTEDVQILSIEKHGTSGIGDIIDKRIPISPRVKEKIYDYFISRNIKIPDYFEIYLV